MSIQADDINRFNAALKLKTQGRYAEALHILDEFKVKYIAEPKFLLIYAGTFYLNKNVDLSIKYFRLLTKIKPASELASLGLFHSYWDANKQRLALKEMDRFLSIAEKIDDYSITLQEQYEQIGDTMTQFHYDIIIKYYNKFIRKDAE